MPALSSRLRSIRRFIAVAAVSYGLCYVAAAQNQQIYLPNSTPRDPACTINTKKTRLRKCDNNGLLNFVRLKSGNKWPLRRIGWPDWRNN